MLNSTLTNPVHRDCCCSYQGEWRNDKKHGDGEAVSADGRTVYQGRFVRGERTGQAKLLLVVSELPGFAYAVYFFLHHALTRLLGSFLRVLYDVA